jgi:hypothetical protein
MAGILGSAALDLHLRVCSCACRRTNGPPGEDHGQVQILIEQHSCCLRLRTCLILICDLLYSVPFLPSTEPSSFVPVVLFSTSFQNLDSFTPSFLTLDRPAVCCCPATETPATRHNIRSPPALLISNGISFRPLLELISHFGDQYLGNNL